MLFETDRLTVRWLTHEDAPFILALQTEEAWLTHIGSRGVTDLRSARAYLEAGPLASYAEHGHGLNHVALNDTGEPVGICGILKRDGLEAPDLGYGFLTAYHGRGYATEAALGTLAHARGSLRLGRIVAITSPDNPGSQRVLEKVGMHLVGPRYVSGQPNLFYST